jgi:hypothetical protein
MFEVSNYIYFVVYNLYYVGQNDNLGTHARPINQDGGSRNLGFKFIFNRFKRNSVKTIIDSSQKNSAIELCQVEARVATVRLTNCACY